MDFGKFLLQLLAVCAILIVLYFAKAVTFPASPAVISITNLIPINLFFLLLSLIILTLIGGFLGKGIRGMKGHLDGLLLAYFCALLIGGLLALLTYLNFPYSLHINLSWLGTSWYDPWIAVFLVGVSLTLIFVV